MLAVWIPELPFQLARLREPALVGRPLGFRSPVAGPTARLWMVDRQARSAGLAAGMPVEVALHRDPGLVVLDPAPSSWMDARSFLSGRLLTYSPVGRLGRFGEAFVDLNGTERIHGQSLDAAEHLRRDLRTSAGWEAHGGLSRSLAASRLAAKAEDRVRLVADGAETTFLAPYLLGALPALEARARARLNHFGLHRVGQVQPMEVATLGRVIPPAQAFQVLRQARGEDQEQLPLLEVAPSSAVVQRLHNPARPKHELALGAWVLEETWTWRLDGQFLRRIRLHWWDEDDLAHRFDLPFEGEDLHTFSRRVEARFVAEAIRRVQIQRVELEAWLGASPAATPLLVEDATRKRLKLEATALRLHRRFGAGALQVGM